MSIYRCFIEFDIYKETHKKWVGNYHDGNNPKFSGWSEIETTTGSQAKADAIKIGGRNLYRSTQVINTEGALYVRDRLYNGFGLVGAWGADKYSLPGLFKKNGQYVVSGYFKQSFEQNRGLNIFINETLIGVVDSVSNNEIFFEFVFEITNFSTQSLKFYAAGGSDVRVIDFKVEKGNKATDWTPAPEDLKSRMETIRPISISFPLTAPEESLMLGRNEPVVVIPAHMHGLKVDKINIYSESGFDGTTKLRVGGRYGAENSFFDLSQTITINSQRMSVVGEDPSAVGEGDTCYIDCITVGNAKGITVTITFKKS